MTEIVPFRRQYQPGVVDLILPIQRKEFNISITLGEQPDLLDIPGFYQKDNGNFWVAVKGAETVGTIALLDIGDGMGALRKMFVKKQYRGSSERIAQRLLSVLLKWCRDHSFQQIFLGTTAKFLAAHRFYEKCGFTEIDTSELPVTFPVMSVDTKFYTYRIVS